MGGIDSVIVLDASAMIALIRNESEADVVEAGANQFIYPLAYDGPEDFDVKNKEYASSPERAALGVDPEKYVDSVEKFSLQPI